MCVFCWIKIDQLALLFHYLMLNMFQMLVHPSSGACGIDGYKNIGAGRGTPDIRPADGHCID